MPRLIAVASVLVLLGSLAVVSGVQCRFAPESTKGLARDRQTKTTGDALEREESVRVRSIVYEVGLCTHIRLDTPLPQREIDLHKDIVALHRQKRVLTIKLLLDIVKGGRPKDAQAAGAIALALEEGADSAVHIVDWDVARFDKGYSPDLPTDREVLVEWVAKALANAEASVRQPNKK